MVDVAEVAEAVVAVSPVVAGLGIADSEAAHVYVPAQLTEFHESDVLLSRDVVAVTVVADEAEAVEVEVVHVQVASPALRAGKRPSIDTPW